MAAVAFPLERRVGQAVLGRLVSDGGACSNDLCCMKRLSLLERG